jgi:hypothetical protein
MQRLVGILGCAFVLACGGRSRPSFAAPVEAASDEAPSGAYYLMAFNNPVVGREAEFNRWYAETHAPEVASNPGVLSAQRYVAVVPDSSPSLRGPRQYLAIYRIETGDLAACFNAFKRPKPTAGESPPLDGTTSFTLTYQRTGAEIRGAGPKSFRKGESKVYEFFVLYTPLPGRAVEFVAWYAPHALQMAATPGVVSAQRLTRSDVQRDRSAPSPPYMVMYKIVTDDLLHVVTEVGRREKTFAPSNAYLESATERYAYEALGPLLVSDKTSDAAR